MYIIPGALLYKWWYWGTKFGNRIMAMVGVLLSVTLFPKFNEKRIFLAKLRDQKPRPVNYFVPTPKTKVNILTTNFRVATIINRAREFLFRLEFSD